MNEKTAKKLNREKRQRRITVLALLLIILFLLCLFGAAALAEFTGSFTINLNYNEMQHGLSLYDNKGFRDPRAKLAADPLRNEMTNITLSNLDLDAIDGVDGSHHGESNALESAYFAYTFYLKNVSPAAHDYEVRINLTDASKNADAAVRIVLISDSTTYDDPANQRDRSTTTVYGKEKSGGGLDVNCDDAFLQERGTIVYFKRTLGIDQSHKYTFVMYLEGMDAECVDDIKGGQVKLNMEFRLLDSGDETT